MLYPCFQQVSDLACWAVLPASLWILGATVVVADRSAPPRAPRPLWPQEVVDTFFVDARTQLVGKRPEKRRTSAAETGNPTAPSHRPQDHVFAWSQLVDGDTLETEIKRIALRLRTDLKSPATFQSGGFKQCRREFSMLAVLFAVIDQFDQDVRWQRDAAALRDKFAQSGFHCKVASEDTYAEAKNRRDLLVDLLRGNHHRLLKPDTPEGASQVADRSVLMQWMERSQKERISVNMGNSSLFRRQAATVGHEAQLLAMLAEWISRPGYEYWDDDPYSRQTHQLRSAATELNAASQVPDYGRARRAAGRVGQACSNCHEDYR